MDKDVMLRISAVAAQHHGAFTRDMALEAGATPSMIDRRLSKGEWQRPYPAVYVVPGSPATWERAVVTSVFGAGRDAAASHRTALHLWGLSMRSRIIEVTSPNRGRPIREHVIHRSTDLAAVDVTEAAGIPTTTVARSLVDVGVPWGEGLASRALDEALRRQMIDLMAVANLLHRVARRGRRGAGVMRSILEDRLGWSSITQSQLEDEYLRITRVAGLAASPKRTHSGGLSDPSIHNLGCVRCSRIRGVAGGGSPKCLVLWRVTSGQDVLWRATSQNGESGTKEARERRLIAKESGSRGRPPN